MPTLEELMEYEGPPSIGEIDRKSYHRLDIIVEFDKYLAAPDMLTIVCMADDWEKSWPARLIVAQKQIDSLTDTLMVKSDIHNTTYHDLQAALERASKVAWLESEVARLTHDLERYRQQEAAQRATKWEPGTFEVQHLRDCDNHKPHAICSLTGSMIEQGICHCSWCVKVRQAGTLKTKEWPATPYFETNSHIAPEAPIFRKLCQCDDCRELRAQSGFPAAEIEGH